MAHWLDVLAALPLETIPSSRFITWIDSKPSSQSPTAYCSTTCTPEIPARNPLNEGSLTITYPGLLDKMRKLMAERRGGRVAVGGAGEGREEGREEVEAMGVG